MIFFKILLGLISTAALVALIIYVVRSRYYLNEKLDIDSYGEMPLKQKVFFSLAAIGFLVCLYNGCYAMLHWMPYDWGG